jgi:hypothetical protein
MPILQNTYVQEPYILYDPEMLPRLGGISHSPLSPEKSFAYYCAALYGVKQEAQGMKGLLGWHTTAFSGN